MNRPVKLTVKTHTGLQEKALIKMTLGKFQSENANSVPAYIKG